MQFIIFHNLKSTDADSNLKLRTE